MQPWAEDLVRRAGLRPGDRVLDVASGTGLVARLAAPRVRWTGKVTGLDLNAGMLGVARHLGLYVHPPIELIEGDVVDMPFPDGAFDAVLCQFGVQYFPDRLAAMKEMRRVTAAGGRMVFNVFRSVEHNQGWIPLIEALDRHVGKDAGDIFRSIFAIKDPAIIRTAAAKAGWRDVRVEIRVDTAHYASVRDLVRWELESMPTPALAEKLMGAGEAIARDLEESMRPHIADNGVVFPCECYVLEASR